MNALIQVPQLQKPIVLQPPASQTSILQPIRQKLIFAQRRLQDRHVPFQLAALSYLRITCAAIQTAEQLGYRETYSKSDSESCSERYSEPASSKTPYLTLVRRLVEQSSHWWELCQVSETGDLISGDRQIQALLQPLNAFSTQIFAIS